MKSRLLAMVVAAVVLLCGPVFAQAPVGEQQGIKPNDSLHGGALDSVSLTDGSLTLHIPLASFPQRGALGLTFTLYSNTKNWQQVNWCTADPGGDPYWNCNNLAWAPLPRGGFLPQSPHTIQGIPTNPPDGAYVASNLDYMNQSFSALEPNDPTNPSNVNTYDWYHNIVSPDGNVRTLAMSNGDTSSGPVYPLRTLDPLGWLIPDGSTLILPNGTRLAFPSNYNALPSSVTDANGNRITIDNSGNYTDTLGRAIPAPSGAATSDLSNCPAGTVSARVWTIPGFNGGARTFKFCYATVSVYSNFALGDGASEFPPTNATLMNAIVLPDLTSYTFAYDHFSNVTRLGLPTGGSISYTYAYAPLIAGYPPLMRVTSRTVDANDGTGGHTWNYSYSAQLTGNPVLYSGKTVITSPPPESNDEVHTISSLQVTGNLYDVQAQYYQGSQGSGAPLVTVATQYAGLPDPAHPGQQTSSGIVPVQVTATLADGHTSKVVTTWDSGVVLNGSAYRLGNQLQRDEYDFSNTLARSTVYHYLWQDNATYKNNNLLRLPAWTTVYNGAPPQTSGLPTCSSTSTPACVAQATFSYDQASVVSSGIGSPTHVGPPAGEPIRGNLNTTSSLLNTTNSFLSSTATYFDTGMAASSTPPANADGLNRTRTYTYSSTFLGAFVTQTNMPDTGNPPVHHIVKANYDFNTGLLTSSTDQNNQTSTYQYDNMLRLTQGNLPDGGQTLLTYPDPVTITRQRLLTSGVYETSTAKFDGLGRSIQDQAVTPECSSNVKTTTTYDAAGRAATVSNPYCLTSESTYGTTQSQYDALSRPIKTIMPDGSFSTVQYSTPPGDGAGASSMVCTTATDEAGKPNQVCRDALGQMMKVLEPNPGASATNATGWVAVSGNEQSGNSQPGASASVTVTIGGSDSLNSTSTTICPPRGTCHTTTTNAADTGSMQFTVVAGGVTIGPVAVPGGYNGSSTPVNLTAALYSAFPANSQVTMSNPNGTATFTLTAASAGSAGNSYTITTSMGTNCVPSSTDFTTVTCGGVGWTMTLSGPNLAPTTASTANFTGGQNASSTPDTGTVTVTVSGTGYSTTYGASDTASTIAGRLATAISGGSCASASASGGTINLTAKNSGTAGACALSASYTWNSGVFTNPSFTTSTSGTALGGAKDAGAINNNPYVTLYQYDLLGNLLRVDQKGSASGDSTQWRTRTFTYNSLSQLLTATNPESGTITYAYDADGNLISKTVPAPNQTGTATVTTTYAYDALNRLTLKSFSDSTPLVNLSYDQASGWGYTLTNTIGRLSSESTFPAWGQPYLEAALFSYDVMGRTVNKWECIPSSCAPSSWALYSLAATYDLAGDMTSYTTGVGVTFTQTLDPVGRVQQLTSSLVDAQHPGTLATVDPTQGHFPNGTLRKLTFGNALTDTTAYNVRLQPCRVNLNSTGSVLSLCNDAVPGGNVQDFTYGFNLSTTDNGNVVSMSATGAQNFNRAYTYDPLNRLLTLSAPGDSCSGLSWTYDAWGNRTDQTVTGGSCNSFHQPVATNNRFSGAGFQYDAAGNMTNDGTHSYTYDAEHRITAVDGGNTASYVYDAMGRRVRKTVGGAWTDYVYDADGRVVTEFISTSGTCTAPCWATSYIYMGGAQVSQYKNGTTYFVHQDHLGSTRLLTKLDRTLQDSMDFLPYGEQIAGASGITHKFTGKERDAESNLDYFGARYYSNTMGRFMSPDWATGPTTVPYAQLGDPQSLNLYAYVRNSPVARIDADGHNYAGWDGYMADRSNNGFPMATWDDLSFDLVDAKLLAMGLPAMQGDNIQSHWSAVFTFASSQGMADRGRVNGVIHVPVPGATNFAQQAPSKCEICNLSTPSLGADVLTRMIEQHRFDHSPLCPQCSCGYKRPTWNGPVFRAPRKTHHIWDQSGDHEVYDDTGERVYPQKDPERSELDHKWDPWLEEETQQQRIDRIIKEGPIGSSPPWIFAK
jgi:RHS repeat-associated protein